MIFLFATTLRRSLRISKMVKCDGHDVLELSSSFLARPKFTNSSINFWILVPRFRPEKIENGEGLTIKGRMDALIPQQWSSIEFAVSKRPIVMFQSLHCDEVARFHSWVDPDQHWEPNFSTFDSRWMIC